MSFYFSIPTAEDLQYRALLEQLSWQEAQFAYATEDNLHEVMYGGARLYLPHYSTRGVSIGRNEAAYEVGINVGASPQDLELALDATMALARLAKTTILPEDEEEPLSVEEFNQTYRNQWLDHHQTHGLIIIRHMIEEKGSILTLNGCLNPFYIGPKLLQQLAHDDPDELVFAERLWDKMQRLQFIDLEREGVRVPGRYKVGEEEEDQWTYTVITPDHPQLLAKTDYTIFVLDEQHLKVPFDLIQNYAQEQDWEQLDEEQYLFPDLSEDEFEQLMQELEEPITGGPASDA